MTDTKQRNKHVSISINRRRWLKFKGLKRGYYSFITIVAVYGISFLLPVLINSKALVVQYKGEYYFPAILDLIPGASSYYPGTKFGQDVPGEANYRNLKKEWESGTDNWLFMPFYPYNPYEDITTEGNKMYEAPSRNHWLGTDNTGRDVFARLFYAFNISISFALILTLINYVIGVLIGGTMGYFGGKFDLIFQRLIEVWSSLSLIHI